MNLANLFRGASCCQNMGTKPPSYVLTGMLRLQSKLELTSVADDKLQSWPKEMVLTNRSPKMIQSKLKNRLIFSNVKPWKNCDQTQLAEDFQPDNKMLKGIPEMFSRLTTQVRTSGRLKSSTEVIAKKKLLIVITSKRKHYIARWMIRQEWVPLNSTSGWKMIHFRSHGLPARLFNWTTMQLILSFSSLPYQMLN